MTGSPPPIPAGLEVHRATAQRIGRAADERAATEPDAVLSPVWPEVARLQPHAEVLPELRAVQVEPKPGAVK